MYFSSVSPFSESDSCWPAQQQHLRFPHLRLASVRFSINVAAALSTLENTHRPIVVQAMWNATFKDLTTLVFGFPVPFLRVSDPAM